MITHTLLIFLFLLTLTETILRVPLTRVEHPKSWNSKYAKDRKIAISDIQHGEYKEELDSFINGNYFGSITVGQPAQVVKVLFDLNSATTQFKCFGCPLQNAGCVKQTFYDCFQSFTCNPKNVSITVTDMAQQSIQGTIYSDILCIGGNVDGYCTTENQTFVCITDPTLAHTVATFDGFFGLSWNNIPDGLSQPLDDIFSDKDMCPEEVFAFWFNNTDHNSGGELSLCGLDNDHYTGDIAWVSLVPGGGWITYTDEIRIEDTQISGSIATIVDPNAGYITVPTEQIQLIEDTVDGIEPITNLVTITCSKKKSLPNIKIVIGGKTFELTPDDYIFQMTFQGEEICISTIVGAHQSPKVRLLILGGAFTKKYYIMFHHGNKQIGFAHSKQ